MTKWCLIFAWLFPGYAHAANEEALEVGQWLAAGSFSDESGILKCGLPIQALRQKQLGRRAPDVAMARPLTQKSILRGAVRVHYDTSGIHAAAMLNQEYQRIPGTADEFADSIAAIANHVIQYETEVLAYPAAPEDGNQGGGPEYDVYIQELGNLYGATYWETEVALRRYTTYMVIDNDFIFVQPDSNRGLPAMRVTLAHEYHHAIQIGNYGWWGYDDLFFYEMTSVWMEDKVYPEVNDYLVYLRSSQGHFARPEVPFTSSGFIMYSRGIWCHYLEQKYDEEMIRKTWETMRTTTPLDALDDVLHGAEYSSSLRSAFVEWTLWNYFTGGRSKPGVYYAEAELYPEITLRASGFTPPSRLLADSLAPLSARYHQILYNADTLTLATSNINVESALGGVDDPFAYSYALNTQQIDPSYSGTSAGIFYKLIASDPVNWHSWGIVNGGVAPARFREAVPFPSPFFVNGRSAVSIPTSATEPVVGTLTIFSTSMGRVSSTTGPSRLLYGRHLFSWNGRTDDGALVESGVYLFVLELPGETLKGKIAVMRE